MKKILTLLPGIVFLITILIASACQNKKQDGTTTTENDTAEVKKAAIPPPGDPSKVDVFLKDTLILGTMHLLMYDSKKSECEVIDNHTVFVNGGYTVKWKNAKGSRIDEIIHIHAVGGDTTFFGAVPVADSTEDNINEFFRKGVYKLIIPNLPPDTDTIIKYEIVFKVREDPDTYTIDPYLELPDEH